MDRTLKNKLARFLLTATRKLKDMKLLKPFSAIIFSVALQQVLIITAGAVFQPLNSILILGFVIYFWNSIFESKGENLRKSG